MLNAPDNFLERELGTKREVSLSTINFPLWLPIWKPYQIIVSKRLRSEFSLKSYSRTTLFYIHSAAHYNTSQSSSLMHVFKDKVGNTHGNVPMTKLYLKSSYTSNLNIK